MGVIEKEMELNAYLFQLNDRAENSNKSEGNEVNHEMSEEKYKYILRRAQTASYNLIVTDQRWKIRMMLTLEAAILLLIFRLVQGRYLSVTYIDNIMLGVGLGVAAIIIIFAIIKISRATAGKEKIYSLTVKFQMSLKNNPEQDADKSLEQYVEDLENCIEHYKKIPRIRVKR